MFERLSINTRLGMIYLDIATTVYSDSDRKLRVGQVINVNDSPAIQKVLKEYPETTKVIRGKLKKSYDLVVVLPNGKVKLRIKTLGEIEHNEILKLNIDVQEVIPNQPIVVQY